VLLCYNSRKLIAQFLPLVKKYMPNDGNYRIVVVDNASADDTPQYLSQYHPDLEVITLPQNHGFTNGYCASLPHINAEYYVLLSADIEVTPGFLEPVIQLMDRDSSIAACQPKVKSWDRKDEFEYAGAAGGFIDYLGYPFCRGRLVNVTEKDMGQYDDVCEIFWASGACLFVRADAYHKAGGLDNDFFAHMEEIDLCWRLRNMGYKIMAVPSSVVYHMGGSVIKYGSPMKVFRNHRNNLIMLLKNLPPYESAWKIPLRFLTDFLTLLKMAADGQFKLIPAVSKAHIQFLWNLPKWLRKRREVRQLVLKDHSTCIYPRAMVVDFFLRGKKRFSQLNFKP
jgi:GT2 family glycosyltransferase